MKMDIVAKNSSANDEYYTPAYAVTPLLKYLRVGSKVWHPFDKEWSEYNKVLSGAGFDVACTHIDDGNDFFDTYVECDYIISNPPYSIKYEVFKRLFELGKPFAMLVGIVGLFESQKRFDLFRSNNFEILYFNKRIKYIKDGVRYISPPFSSVYVCSGILPDRICFDVIEV